MQSLLYILSGVLGILLISSLDFFFRGPSRVRYSDLQYLAQYNYSNLTRVNHITHKTIHEWSR